MSIAKTVEVIAESTKSFEDAVKTGIKEADSRLRNVKGAWIAEQKVEIDQGNIIKYRVIMRITFVLE